jgi:hypothetical protein
MKMEKFNGKIWLTLFNISRSSCIIKILIGCMDLRGN